MLVRRFLDAISSFAPSTNAGGASSAASPAAFPAQPHSSQCSSQSTQQDPAPQAFEQGAQGEQGARVPFGARDVGSQEKPALVASVFDRVSRRYDVMNDVMSAGGHRLWRQYLMARISPRPSDHLIDIAGGTGDIALRFKRAGGGRVVICDPTASMLEIAERRARNNGWSSEDVKICLGAAEALPVETDVFDIATIAFGLRNVTDISMSLREAKRVLKPGGRFYCLEFSQAVHPTLENLVRRYNHTVLPFMGKIVVGDSAPYTYLAESIVRFPNQQRLADLMSNAGFDRVSWVNLSGGVVAVHFGVA